MKILKKASISESSIKMGANYERRVFVFSRRRAITQDVFNSMNTGASVWKCSPYSEKIDNVFADTEEALERQMK